MHVAEITVFVRICYLLVMEFFLLTFASTPFSFYVVINYLCCALLLVDGMLCHFLSLFTCAIFSLQLFLGYVNMALHILDRENLCKPDFIESSQPSYF